MLLAHSQSKKKDFIVDDKIFPQTLEVLQTRARPLGINIVQIDLDNTIPMSFFADAFGLLIQLPNSHGNLKHREGVLRLADVHKCMKIAIVDPLAQVLMQPVGELGFDIAVGSMQRFGVPMGFGGPHAAFFAITDKFKRKIPGRIVGHSIDAKGNKA